MGSYHPRWFWKQWAGSTQFPGSQKYWMSIMYKTMLRPGDTDINKPSSLTLKSLPPCDNVHCNRSESVCKNAHVCQAWWSLQSWSHVSIYHLLTIITNQVFSKFAHYVFVFMAWFFFSLLFIVFYVLHFFFFWKNVCDLLYLKILTRHHSLSSWGLSCLSPWKGGAKPGKEVLGERQAVCMCIYTYAFKTLL